MKEEKKRCKCSVGWLAAIVVLAVIAAIVLMRRHGGNGAAGGEEEQSIGATGVVEGMIEERMSDAAYVDGLNQIAQKYEELNGRLNAAMKEYGQLMARKEKGETLEGDEENEVLLCDKIARLEEAID